MRHKVPAITICAPAKDTETADDYGEDCLGGNSSHTWPAECIRLHVVAGDYTCIFTGIDSYSRLFFAYLAVDDNTQNTIK